MDEGDAASQTFLAKELLANRPDDAVLSEEGLEDPRRFDSDRVWIIDPLDGTREYGESGRTDWAVHVALWDRDAFTAGAVSLPALGVTLTTDPPPRSPDGRADPTGGRDVAVALVVRRTAVAAEAIGADVISIGSAGAKAMAVVTGIADVYVHAGGMYQWDSAAPAAVALAAGLHVSRIDGSRWCTTIPTRGSPTSSCAARRSPIPCWRRSTRRGRSGSGQPAVMSEPSDLSWGAFGGRGPWVLDRDSIAWRRAADDAHDRARGSVPGLIAARRLPPGRRAGVVAGRLALATVPWLVRRRRGKPATTAQLYRSLRLAAETLGPTYIKLGQIISSGEGLFPAELVEEFKKCRDQVPAEPFDVVMLIVEQDLGARWRTSSNRSTTDAARRRVDRPGPRGPPAHR